MADLDALIAPRLQSLRASGRLRRLHGDGESLIDAASNDYLGLSRHPFVIDNACAWTRRCGAGNRASRLLGADRDDIGAVEAQLAAFVGCEAALVFCSGFQLNSSVLPALFELDAAPQLFSDRLVHASVHAGCRGRRQHRYRHNDLQHLQQLLERHPAPLRFILSETVFSMDGDCADVAALAALAAQHGAVLYLDEAHACGVLGPDGRGLAATLTPAPTSPPPLIMGALGKAFGAAGAWIAGSQQLIDWLLNRCAGFIYSTAPPPAVFGALEAALQLIPAMDAERARLMDMAQTLRRVLHERGIDTLAATTQIVPALLGAEATTMAAAQRLRAAGVRVGAIRPPTAPPGMSRLRFSLSTAISDAEFEHLLAAAAQLP